MIKPQQLIIITGLAFGAVACGVIPDGNPTPGATPTPTEATAATATPVPTVEATPQEPKNLTLWLPDVLTVSASGEGSADLLTEQITAFAETNDDLTIEIRRKQVREVGGIMPTLRTARYVAPGVLPDLTLIRRDDLLAAVESDLIQPMEGVVASAIIGDLFSSALSVGQVDGTLYALPYALDIQHVIYHADQPPPSAPTFSQYTESEIPLLFPAARASGLNAMFFAQYLAANPRAADSGTLEIDEQVLLGLFQYYEEAAAKGLISPDVVNYSRPADYRTLITSENFGSAFVSSEFYLDLTTQGQAYTVGSLPTANGQPATTIDGWMWVMTTTNPTRQALIGDFLEWMMDVERQGAFARSVNLLPSQRTALDQQYDEAYTEFVLSVMPNASLPHTSAASSAPARAIQKALLAVLAGERSAEAATQEVLNQLTS